MGLVSRQESEVMLWAKVVCRGTVIHNGRATIHRPAISGRHEMLNLIDERKPIGVLFSDENLKAAPVHDISPAKEERIRRELNRIFGKPEEQKTQEGMDPDALPKLGG